MVSFTIFLRVKDEAYSIDVSFGPMEASNERLFLEPILWYTNFHAPSCVSRMRLRGVIIHSKPCGNTVGFDMQVGVHYSRIILIIALHSTKAFES